MRPIQPTPNNTPARRWVIAALLTLAVFVQCVVAAGEEQPASSPDSSPPELERIRADDLLPLLATHRGKVVLVNFWATWCGPCIHEIPALIRLRDKLDPETFALVAISLDDPADSSWLVPEFIETRFPNWNSYLSAEVEDYLLVAELDPYWSGVMPANYVIGPDGELVKTMLGGHSEEKFESAVKAAMQEPEEREEDGD